MEIENIHHVSLTVSDLELSRRFYREILGLKEIRRPDFPFPGAWFQVGDGEQLHLIVHAEATFRSSRQIDTKDVHFALRVSSFERTLQFLHSKGFSESLGNTDPLRMEVRPHATAGFPQIYILDPDHHVIEINAAKLD